MYQMQNYVWSRAPLLESHLSLFTEKKHNNFSMIHKSNKTRRFQCVLHYNNLTAHFWLFNLSLFIYFE